MLGGTKAGSTPSEAMVFFDKALARRLDQRLKHMGQLVSKARYLAAPWIGLLESGAWLARSVHANAMARRLAERHAVSDPSSGRIERRLRGDGRRRPRPIAGAGWFAYRFIDGSVRFMCSWGRRRPRPWKNWAALAAIA